MQTIAELCLWPSLLWPSLLVTIIAVAVVIVAVVVVAFTEHCVAVIVEPPFINDSRVHTKETHP